MRIVGDPRLRISTAVPPGTTAPGEECDVSFEPKGPAISRSQTLRLDAVLVTIDLGGTTLIPLRLGGHSKSTLCTTTTGPIGRAALDVSITGGQPLPIEKRPVPGAGANRPTVRQIAKAP